MFYLMKNAIEKVLLMHGIVFEHDFWTNESVISESFALRKSYLSYTDTEEFIENEVCNICEQYYVKVDCKVEAKGFPLNL